MNMLSDNFKSMFQIIKKSKFAINIVIITLLFILIYVGVSIAYKVSEIKNNSQVIDQSLRDTITIKGEAKLEIVPDIALLNFGVVTEKKTVEAAQKENNKQMTFIVKELKKEAIKKEDLKTSNYSIQPKYNYNKENGARTLAGYEINQNLQVKIRDFNKIGKIIQLASNIGANRVGNLRFMIDDEVNARANARGEAIRNAKEKAKILAKQLGIRLGDIISFYESGTPRPYCTYDTKAVEMGRAMDKSFNSPSIEPGTNEIFVSVELVYEIAH